MWQSPCTSYPAHKPRSIRLAVAGFQYLNNPRQRLHINLTAYENVVGQGHTEIRHHQADAHLLTVRAFVAGILASRLRRSTPEVFTTTAFDFSERHHTFTVVTQIPSTHSQMSKLSETRPDRGRNKWALSKSNCNIASQFLGDNFSGSFVVEAFSGTFVESFLCSGHRAVTDAREVSAFREVLP